MSALLLAPAGYVDGDRHSAVAYMQTWPFESCRSELRRQLGIEVIHMHANTLKEIEAAAQLGIPAAAIFVRPRWSESPEDVERTMRLVRAMYPAGKIFFIDPFDQTSSRFFSVLPHVDWFLKYTCLKDPSVLLQPLHGGTYMTHVLRTQFGYELGEWHVGSDVPPGHETKVVPSWFAVPPHLVRNIVRFGMPWNLPWHRKDIDICCHVNCESRETMEWYGRMRKASIDALQELRGECVLSVNADFIGEPRIDHRTYVKHMRRARIAFSPMGWGEITARSFEAVASGCLYIQPAVDHISMHPNLVRPHETYVPVKWDYSDLGDVCKHYLAHPEEADRIIANARRECVDYYRQSRWIAHLADLLKA